MMQGCRILPWKFTVMCFDPPDLQKSFDTLQIFIEYNTNVKDETEDFV